MQTCEYGCSTENINELCSTCGHEKRCHTSVHPHVCLGKYDSDFIHVIKYCACAAFTNQEKGKSNG